MKIDELRIWHFRCFGSSDPAKDEKPDPKPVIVSLDSEITALIGRNGSGKSALLEALQRLFGETRDERNVRPSDFFVPPGETIESAPLGRCMSKFSSHFQSWLKARKKARAPSQPVSRT